MLQRGLGVLAAWNDFPIAFHRDPFTAELKDFEQPGDIAAGFDAAFAAVDGQGNHEKMLEFETKKPIGETGHQTWAKIVSMLPRGRRITALP